MEKKVILFGGTFDPIHYGHTAVAASAAKYLYADQLIFVPAHRSPLKHACPAASGMHRFEMISLAIKNKKKLHISDFELKKNATSYTLDTVKHFQNNYGTQAKIHWLVGADSVDDLMHWYKIDELIETCNLCVMYRAGYEKPTFGKIEKSLGKSLSDKLAKNVIATPLVDISSTEIRSRLAAGEDVSDMLDPAVLEYIRRHNLYK